jgi:hypothetical protein
LGDLFFIFRMMVYTFIFVFLLQIKVGEQTIDEKAHAWIRASIYRDVVQQAAEGGWEAFKVGYQQFVNKMDDYVETDQMPGRRQLPDLERSTKFIKKQTAKLQKQKELLEGSMGGLASSGAIEGALEEP